jgi:AcrR family transcriptional regulator
VPDAPADSTSPSSTRRAERRAELTDRTIELIRRDGPLVSMDRIAAECGVTKPIIYRYFGDREGLVREVACRLVAEFTREMARVSVPPAQAREHLAATMDAYLAVVEREANLYRFINHHTSVERRDLFGRLMAEQFAAALRHRLRHTAVPEAASRTWGYALVGILHNASDWWSDEQAMSRSEVVEHLMTLVWNGLANVPVTGAPDQRARRQ